MEYIAIAKNIKITPRKLRLVVDSVKKNNLQTALSALSVMNKRAADPLKKVIESAIANAVSNFKADKGNLEIKDIMITEGTSMKRFHFAARGRVRPYKKRTSHIRVILSDNNIKNQKSNVKNTDEKSKTENSSIKQKGKEDEAR